MIGTSVDVDVIVGEFVKVGLIVNVEENIVVGVPTVGVRIIGGVGEINAGGREGAKIGVLKAGN
jgi:hypothetical protein